jgi:CBS-domain-containing membrane protein
MKAESWMTREVRTCRPETSMNEAAHLMWSTDCGVLPVVDDDQRVVGMITDRDMCMGAYLQGRPLKDMNVADSMSRTVHACQAADTIEQVIRRMADNQVRRVPVLDARGKLAGILSLNDIARRVVAMEERERVRLVPRLVEAQASICETRECASVPEVTSVRRAAGQPMTVG